MTLTPEDLVRREVHYCVSSLVSNLANGYGLVRNDDLARNPRARELDGLLDQALELVAPIDDWEEAAIQEGWVKRGFGETVKWWNATNDDGSRYCDKASSLRALCEDHAIEPYQREVFEHWIVSDWLADKLAKKGEKVDKDFSGLTVWARTTTGQGVASDSVIAQICADLNAS